MRGHEFVKLQIYANDLDFVRFLDTIRKLGCMRRHEFVKLQIYANDGLVVLEISYGERKTRGNISLYNIIQPQDCYLCCSFLLSSVG